MQMKTPIPFGLVALSLTSLSPAVAVAAPAPQTAPAHSEQAELPAALRNYLIGYTAASFESVVALTTKNQASDVLASVEAQIKILSTEPSDKLPAELQAYVKEALVICEKAASQMRPLASQGTDLATLGVPFDAMKNQLRALGKKYPSAQNFLIDTAVSDKLIMQELGFQKKFDELFALELPKNNNDLAKTISAVFSILSKELRMLQNQSK